MSFGVKKKEPVVSLEEALTTDSRQRGLSGRERVRQWLLISIHQISVYDARGGVGGATLLGFFCSSHCFLGNWALCSCSYTTRMGGFLLGKKWEKGVDEAQKKKKKKHGWAD